MNFIVRLNRYFQVFALCLMLIISSCSVLEVDKLSDEELFQAAQKKYDQKDYRGARAMLIKFKNKFPKSDHISTARLLIADSYFFDKDYTESRIQYEIFLKYHPADTRADYATFQLALSKKKDVSKPDRDQDPTYTAIAAFQQVVDNFPGSPYVEMATTEINSLRTFLAEHELYVGKFYLRIKAYSSAINRFEYLLRNYPNLGLDTETMYNLVKTLVRSNRPEDANIWFQNLVTRYENDPWTKKAIQEFSGDLNSLNAKETGAAPGGE